MIELQRFGDVARVRMWTWRTLAVGYDVSAYLVRGMLVDTGFRHVAPALVRALAELSPRGIVVTHWHEDHAGNAPELAARFPMWMPAATEATLRARPQVRLYRRFTWGRPTRLEGTVTALDPAPLRTIATPGHSADHHVVFDDATRTLISGDLWLGVKVRVMGRDENPYEIIESLTRVIALEPQRMFDAHRGLVENPVAALAAKRSWLEETTGDIERRLDAGQSESQILDEALGGEERTAVVSQGEYSRRNLIRCIRRHRPLGGNGMKEA